jgi:cytochrome c553
VRFWHSMHRLVLLPAAAALALGSCGGPKARPDPFARTGKLIALSGGAAGPTGACVRCHGLTGEGDGMLSPRLAGSDAGHTLRQLESFALGQRRHLQMKAIARALGDRERQAVSMHYAALVAPVIEAAGGECAAPARKLYLEGEPRRDILSCVSCHGGGGRATVAGNPMLAGQPAPYLAAQLTAWAEGARYGDPQGVMRRISRQLSTSERVAVASCAAVLGDG